VGQDALGHGLDGCLFKARFSQDPPAHFGPGHVVPPGLEGGIKKPDIVKQYARDQYTVIDPLLGFGNEEGPVKIAEDMVEIMMGPLHLIITPAGLPVNYKDAGISLYMGIQSRIQRAAPLP
jgi:hypothetical protein